MMTKRRFGIKKFSPFALSAVTMLALAVGLSWRVIGDSTAVDQNDSEESKQVSLSSTLTQEQLTEYANQLAIEHQRLIAYRLELESLVQQIYANQGKSLSTSELNKNSFISPTIQIKPAPVPALASSIQGNSNGS